MSNDVLIPIFASIITLILTKVFDMFMASRKNQLDTLTQSLTTVDEITGAAFDTISYLKTEISELRQANRDLKCTVKEKDSIIKDLVVLANGNGKNKEA